MHFVIIRIFFLFQDVACSLKIGELVKKLFGFQLSQYFLWKYQRTGVQLEQGVRSLMHRPMHLGVIIHFTEFKITAVQRPADSLLLAFTGKTSAGSKNSLFQSEKDSVQNHTHSHFPPSSRILQTVQTHIKLKKKIKTKPIQLYKIHAQ